MIESDTSRHSVHINLEVFKEHRPILKTNNYALLKHILTAL